MGERHERSRGRRRGQRSERDRQPRKPQQLDEVCGLPLHLVESVRATFGDEGLERVTAGWEAARTRPVTLRANTLRSSLADVTAELDAAGIGWTPVPWYPDAVVLANDVRERDVWETEAYRTGSLYLQSLSSMLPPLVLGPLPGADVLDMCAAPGGKTSQMAALGTGEAGERAAHITACEFSRPRADKLEHNLAKLGATNVHVMRTDARQLDPLFRFDQILVDAPCTGSGTVHTHDDHAARGLTPELAARVERSQRALLDRALEVLKPGGSLVYSTCSILPRENEGVVEWALARHADCELAKVSCPWEGAANQGLVPELLPCRLPGALVICPTRLFEGFFVARIEKKG